MDMHVPIGRNPIDLNDNGLIGKPIDRVDGRLKVTGQATYAYEYRVTQRAAYGVLVEAGIAKGSIESIDTAAAERAPGVLLVLTHKNAPEQAPAQPKKTASQLQGPDIAHHGQPVALVVAESFEAARAAAYLIKISYQEKAGRFDLASRKDSGKKPEPMMSPPDSKVGQFDEAFAAAPVQVDATYTTPHQVHIQMEPHATLAEWEGDQLTVYTSNQWLAPAQKVMAATLKIAPEKVRVVSRYVGGGFGSKLETYADAVFAALASRQLQRPVKVALTRQQIFHVCSHRSETIQRIRLGASADGKLTAIGHEVWSENLPGQSFYEMAADQTRSLYAGANRMTAHRLVELDLPVSASMRAPGEAVGLLALECAVDELAEKLNMDPIELRIRNEPAMDPEKNVPFSTRNLVRCMREGAARFGWSARNAKPAQVRRGRWLVGIGMAAAIRANPLRPSKAEVSLGSDGRLTVRAAMTDIGTGSYTIFSQIAAELLGLPVDMVTVELGDTDFPEASGSGGSWGAGSAGSGIYDACINLRAKLAQLAGVDAMQARFENGAISHGKTTRKLSELAGAQGAQGIQAKGEIKPGDERKKFSQYAFGAHFAEVAVDVDTGEIRLLRMLGVFAAGRILNQKTARSQAIGGMTFGIGAALTEEAVVDQKFGFFANHDMAEYHVPTHADVQRIDAIYLDEVDDKSNPLKSKGVGELGICGAGAAIANAVYNACGVRVRDYPLTLDKVLAGTAAQAAA